MTKRLQASHYTELAQVVGFEWIGKYPQNTHEVTLWRCSEGHEWNACYHNIAQGHGCPYCTQKARKSKQDYHQVAQEQGFYWIGDCLPKNNSTPTTWKCGECGHTWTCTYKYIRREYGCPNCRNYKNGNKYSSQQAIIAKMLNGKINFKSGRYYIDIALPSKRIAIEYDGWYWHGGKEDKDKQRVKSLLKKGWKVRVIKSSALVPTSEQLERLINSEEAYAEIVLEDWGKGEYREW